ncbi:MAG: phosphate ABC transporter substrate-binding protein [Candidatus Thermoplasmatota archaeon]|nr:phosphate ABC transporter substrate-binding protein [Candidatus Thermoplasmatota archaeon]
MEISKALVIGIQAMILVAGFAGCIGGETSQEPVTLKVSGSTTVLPIVQKSSEIYMDMKEHDYIDIQVSAGGSGVGISDIGQMKVDIGMSSRDVKSSEMAQYPNITKTVIAKDCIAVIVNKNVGVSALTVEQIRGIYNGTFTNWNQVGGSDATIVIYGRDSTSGTYEYFKEHVMLKKNFTTGVLEKNSNGGVKSAVQETPNSIGYVSLGYIDSTVKALKIKTGTTEVEATKANVLAGTYPISRDLYLLTNGAPTGEAKAFIDFLLSADGQAIVEEEGFVPING